MKTGRIITVLLYLISGLFSSYLFYSSPTAIGAIFLFLAIVYRSKPGIGNIEKPARRQHEYYLTPWEGVKLVEEKIKRP